MGVPFLSGVVINIAIVGPRLARADFGGLFKWRSS